MGRLQESMILAVCLVLLVSAIQVFAQTPPSPQPTDAELRGLVQLLEDPGRREALLRDLKALLTAREALQPPPLEARSGRGLRTLLVEQVFSALENAYRSVTQAVSELLDLFRTIPKRAESLRGFAAVRENRIRLFQLLGNLAGALLLGLAVRGILRRYLARIPASPSNWLMRLLAALAALLLRMLPYAALTAGLMAGFMLFPTFPLARAVILLLAIVLFFYRLSIEIFRALLAPDLPRRRLLPLGDENANYAWVWAARFANYTAFYAAVIRPLRLLPVEPATLALIRGVLLLVFPVLITVLIMQAARELRLRYGAPKPGIRPAEPARLRHLTLSYWPVLGVTYAWLVFIFLIAHYQAGFQFLFRATVHTAIALLGLLVALRLLEPFFRLLFKVNSRVRARFPGLEERTDRYIQLVRRSVAWVLLGFTLAAVAQIWGIPVTAFLGSRIGMTLILRAVAISVTCAVVMVILEISRLLKNFLLLPRKGREPSQKMRTLVPMVATAVRIGAAFVGGVIVLDQLGINTTPILAGAGIVGLAVGFGSQTLVKDLINGLFILFEESVRVGDWVALGAKNGLVEAVGLRTVRLRDVNGNVHVIPNSSIDTLTNYSKEYSRYVIEVGVAYREDVEEVMAVMRQVGEEMLQDPDFGPDILQPMEVFGVDRFDDSAVIIRARFTTKPLRQWAVKREFNRRIKKTFDEKGIEIPFPHRTIYMGEPKEGAPPPVYVQVGKKQEENNG